MRERETDRQTDRDYVQVEAERSLEDPHTLTDDSVKLISWQLLIWLGQACRFVPHALEAWLVAYPRGLAPGNLLVINEPGL